MLLDLFKQAWGIVPDTLDRVWHRVMVGVAYALFVVLIVTPLLAHWGGHGFIPVMMFLYAIGILTVAFQLKLQGGVGIAAFVYGIPAGGDASDYAKKAFVVVARITFLVLIWGEVYMAVYFHFPSLAKEWWQVGSAVSIMLVVAPTVIYAVGASKMADGPWHKPILFGCVILLAVIAIGAVPHTMWTSVGINPVWFKMSETATQAQVIREQSWRNLDTQKADALESLKEKVEKGQVLSSEELETMIKLEEEVRKGVPKLPPTQIGEVAKKGAESLDGVEKETFLWAGAVLFGLLVLWYAVKHKILGRVLLVIAIGYGAWYFLGTNTEVAMMGMSSGEQPQQNAARGNVSQFKPSFITRDEWGHLTAKEVSETGTLGLGFEIIEGSAQGKRPVPFLGIARGDSTKPTIIIARDPDAEYKDFIIEIPYPCDTEFPDGMRGCGTTWRQHYAQKEVRPGWFEHDPGVRGPANLLKDQIGLRWIQLFKDQELYAMYKVIVN